MTLWPHSLSPIDALCGSAALLGGLVLAAQFAKRTTTAAMDYLFGECERGISVGHLPA